MSSPIPLEPVWETPAGPGAASPCSKLDSDSLGWVQLHTNARAGCKLPSGGAPQNRKLRNWTLQVRDFQPMSLPTQTPHGAPGTEPQPGPSRILHPTRSAQLLPITQFFWVNMQDSMYFLPLCTRSLFSSVSSQGGLPSCGDPCVSFGLAHLCS